MTCFTRSGSGTTHLSALVLWYHATVVENDMKQTTAWLPEAQYEWLRRAAFERKVSQSEIIRELIAAAMTGGAK